ncbi:MAG: GspMb/PilO family protein [Pyrinomonadaceae bacterium]
MPASPAASRGQISIPFRQMGRAPALSVIGLPELIGLAGAALLAITVVFAYFYFYLPANAHLKSAELERTQLQGERQSLGVAINQGESTKVSVDRINASLEDFESNWLPVQSSGRTSLYTVLNSLIKSNGLRNTAGPTYSQLDLIGAKTQVQPGASAEKQNNAKWQSIYPGIAVSVTVEGAYQNIRHFVRDIETSRQFLIINAIELEGVRQSGSAEQQQPFNAPVQPRAGRTSTSAEGPAIAAGRGGLVSLRLDMATYFQRPGATTSAP